MAPPDAVDPASGDDRHRRDARSELIDEELEYAALFEDENTAADGDDLVADDSLTAARTLEPEDALELLRHAELTVEGQVVDASNATLYMRAEHNGITAAAAYKPVAGERPLWDFPDGTLAEREVAAYAVSAATGWRIVPPTVLREGPYGLGMVQLWIATDDAVDVRRLLRSSNPVLYRMTLFDAVVNNADRKGGHILPDTPAHVYGIDHGLCFHVEEKLRTVLWNWAGDPIADAELEVLARLRNDFDRELAGPLSELLTVREVRRTRQRIERLLRACVLPEPSRHRPPVPWPPF